MISLSRYWGLTRLINRCLKRPADEHAWREFVRRFDSTIRTSVVRATALSVGAGLEGPRLNLEMRDDLVDSVYRRLVEGGSRLLKRFKDERPGSFRAYLALVSVRVVSGYLREAVERDVLVPLDDPTVRIARAAGR